MGVKIDLSYWQKNTGWEVLKSRMLWKTFHKEFEYTGVKFHNHTPHQKLFGW